MSIERRISHQALEKSFVEAIKTAVSTIKVQVQPRSSRTRRPDIVIEKGDQRLFIEIKNSRYTSDIIRSIYQVVGYFNLTTERFDLLYIVIPREAFSSSSVKQLLSEARKQSREKIGTITYSVSDNTITYEVVGPNVGLLPDKFTTGFSMPRRIRSRVSLSSPKALRTLRQILLKSKTTQLAVAGQTGVSIGYVNRIVSYLRDQDIMSYKGRNLVLMEPWKLLNEVSWSRSMHNLKLADLFLSDEGRDVEDAEWVLKNMCKEKKVPYAFTLFSAARRYSTYVKKYDSVHLYVDNYEQYKKYFLNGDIKERGHGIRVEIFQPDSEDILKESKNLQGFNICSEIQTVIDLACYGTIGKELAVEIYTKIRSEES